MTSLSDCAQSYHNTHIDRETKSKLHHLNIFSFTDMRTFKSDCVNIHFIYCSSPQILWEK